MISTLVQAVLSPNAPKAEMNVRTVFKRMTVEDFGNPNVFLHAFQSSLNTVIVEIEQLSKLMGDFRGHGRDQSDLPKQTSCVSCP
jgi:hypothetical protein